MWVLVSGLWIFGLELIPQQVERYLTVSNSYGLLKQVLIASTFSTQVPE